MVGRSEAIRIEAFLFGDVPPRRGIHVVVWQVEQRGLGENVEIFVAMVHQRQPEYDGVGGPGTRAQR